MRFEKYCFGLGVPVVPVAMKVINPWPLEVCIARRVHRLSTGSTAAMPLRAARSALASRMHYQ